MLHVMIRLPVVMLSPIIPGLSIWIEVPLIILLLMLLYVFVLLKLVRRFFHFPAPAFIGRGLDSRPRKRLQPPSMIIEALGLESGMAVLEIGCGPGTFTLDVAKAVAPDGIVYAVDIQEKMLDQLRTRMKGQSVENIMPILADAEGRIPLESETCDRAFSVTVLPEIPDRVKALAEIGRILKTGGLYGDAELVIDPDWPLPRTVKKWAEAAGLKHQSMRGNPLRYVLVFSK